mmetsp:Transcript_85835/g.179360  ORF Transcript_85835/g.179360 Transcript_85835/m.179360 type:complete len:221 (+) Transcript_85835:677-1339(+)
MGAAAATATATATSATTHGGEDGNGAGHRQQNPLARETFKILVATVATLSNNSSFFCASQADILANEAGSTVEWKCTNSPTSSTNHSKQLLHLAVRDLFIIILICLLLFFLVMVLVAFLFSFLIAITVFLLVLIVDLLVVVLVLLLKHNFDLVIMCPIIKPGGMRGCGIEIGLLSRRLFRPQCASHRTKNFRVTQSCTTATTSLSILVVMSREKLCLVNK